MSIEHYLPDCTVPTVKHTKTFWIMLHVQEQFEKGPFIFQNDCAPVLKARSINTWLDEFGRPWLAHTEPWPAFLLLTSFLKMLISFSSRIWHLPHCQKHQKLVKWPWCWCAWLASKLTRWGIVKRKMRDTRPNNADDLKATVKETWASIPPQQCHKLITSMPRRIEAVIKAKWAPTKYWVHIQ